MPHLVYALRTNSSSWDDRAPNMRLKNMPIRLRFHPSSRIANFKTSVQKQRVRMQGFEKPRERSSWASRCTCASWRMIECVTKDRCELGYIRYCPACPPIELWLWKIALSPVSRKAKKTEQMNASRRVIVEKIIQHCANTHLSLSKTATNVRKTKSVVDRNQVIV